MMLRGILNTLELWFWNVTIPLMTRSKVVQSVVRSTYQTFQDQDLKRNIALAVAVSCVGFATGLLAYSITILVA
jgi:hypothetical protein